MITKLCLFTVAVIFGLAGHSQNSLPPFFEIKTDNVLTQDIDKAHWQILPDKTGKWIINDVTKPPLTNNFYRRDSVTKSADTITNTYWVRYRFKNTMPTQAAIALEAFADNDDFYVLDTNNHITSFRSGTLVNWKNKSGLKLDSYVPLTIAPGEEITVYERLQNTVPGLPEGFAIEINSTQKIIQRDYVNYIENSNQLFSLIDAQNIFLSGMLLFAVFFNLVFYFIVREKEYLFFSLFLLALCVTRFLNPVAIYLYFNNPQLAAKVGYFNIGFSFIMFFLIQFIRYFFKVSASYPRLSKLLLILGYCYAIFNIISDFIDPDYLLNYSDSILLRLVFSLLMGVICLSIIVVFVLFIPKKGGFHKLVIAGGLPLMLFWGLSFPFTGIEFYRNKAYGTQSQWLMNYYWLIEIIAIACFLLFVSLVLFLRFNALRKENAQQALDKEIMAKEKETERALLIEQQKVELEKTVEQRTAALKQSLEELKSTQAQLIQSEKMASLGELTAGIAHEIQNPLNFVNNFSELNKEMLLEMNDEIDKGNLSEVKSIAKDVIDNEQKINHHGKRADSIVKGMLQHSRSSSGVKELTNINALADEYLRLAYHGLRAKDKDFNATIKTDFDESIGNINIIPQDFGRVLLNLYTNAFYAVNEKSKMGDEKYQPTVSVSTKKENNTVEIVVEDNGNGIPPKVVDKIFQPFFTTKPTGQGTGLGLSLSYDIVKAHGGEIKVDTKEGEGSEFIIQLPVI
jgi:two-component system, NtrC family, sensor kinase